MSGAPASSRGAGQRKLAGILVEDGQVVETGSDLQMLWSKGLLCLRERSSVDRLGLGVVSLHPINSRKGAERLHPEHFHLEAARRLVHDRHRLFGQGFRLDVVGQLDVQAGQGVQDIGHIGMLWADGTFDEGERLPAERDGLLEPSLSSSRDGQIVEADGFVQGVEPSTLSTRLLGRLRR
jgi:hypothetical protein